MIHLANAADSMLIVWNGSSRRNKMGMKLHQENVWAGTEASLKAALEAEEGATQRLAAGNYTQEQEQELPRLLEISDGVAVISIKG